MYCGRAAARGECLLSRACTSAGHSTGLRLRPHSFVIMGRRWQTHDSAEITGATVAMQGASRGRDDVLTVDEGLLGEWPTERDQGLLFDVPLTQEARTHLVEVVLQGQGWEDLFEPAEPTEPLATPEGYAVRVEQGSARFLSMIVDLLDRRGLVGDVHGYTPTSPSASESLLVGPWAVVWLRPRRESSLPGATARVLDAMRHHLDRHSGQGECHLSTLQGDFRVQVRHLNAWLTRWNRDESNVRLWPVSGPEPGPIAVMRRPGVSTLVGLAYGPFDETLDGAEATFDEFRMLLRELASVIDYAVAAVHRDPLHASIGLPFQERHPKTDVVVYGPDYELLDRVVLDAGPMQVLGPGHQFEVTDDLEVEDLADGRRLVTVGSLASWLADLESETALVAHARSVMGRSLPSRDELIRLRKTQPAT